jgi:hypothetical protein
MRWLLAPLVWLVVLILAIGVLWRLWCGRPVVLRGRWAPRILRVVAILLVAVGAQGEEAPAAPDPLAGSSKKAEAAEPLPGVVTARSLEGWLVLQEPTSPWSRFKQAYVRAQTSAAPAGTFQAAQLQARALPPRLRTLVEADLAARSAGKPVPAVRTEELTAALDQLEQLGYYDHWLNAYLWRRSATANEERGKERIELYGRLERHARLVNTLLRAQALIRPVLEPPRAWMSKAGPSKIQRNQWQADRQKALGDLLGAAKVLYRTADSGTWLREGLAVLTVAKQSAIAKLVRAGHEETGQPGETLRFHRLDLLVTRAGERPVVLEHAWLGKMTLPAGRVVSVWELPAYLSKDARQQTDAAIKDALDGDDQAAARLEQALPLVHDDLRRALALAPHAKGAPRLRLILSLFDDTVLPSGGD